MNILKTFQEGFVGAFSLAVAIVMAVVSVASAFLHGETYTHQRNQGESATKS